MIPRIIHYCWFGNEDLPKNAIDCIKSWHTLMPDYEYKLWNEENFDINYNQYVKEAYYAKKYAFVSDVARLKALSEEGGIYLDVDFEVYKSFDSLLNYRAFAGFEGSKSHPVMMGVIASEAHGEWVTEQLQRYNGRHFIVNGEQDLTTNVRFITDNMIQNGFCPNGIEQDYKDLHIFPVDFFCPRQTTGEYFRTANTYCDHKGLVSSWATNKSIKNSFLNIFSPRTRTRIIRIKRSIFG